MEKRLFEVIAGDRNSEVGVFVKETEKTITLRHGFMQVAYPKNWVKEVFQENA